MTRHPAMLMLVALPLHLACAGPSLEQRRISAAPALDTLRAGAWIEAEQEAARTLGEDLGNPYARLVRAVVKYKTTLHQLSADIRTTVISGLQGGQINLRFLRFALEKALEDLATVDADLVEAARHERLAIELCPACWQVDWNGDGEADLDDALLFQIERDAQGQEYPPDDPRRRPIIRFDHGDLLWARAYLSFQRAVVNTALAYDWSTIEALIREDEPPRVVFELIAPERIAAARTLILAGLDLSDRARLAYLAETDDDREWLPSPAQQSHVLPLPVNDALYDTWAGVVGDIRGLAEGKTGLDLGELIDMTGEQIDTPPTGMVDLGKMLAEPRDIILDVPALAACEDRDDMECAAKALFGRYYVPSMPATPLVKRLARMHGEVEAGHESFKRKLMYLLWIN